MGNMITAGHHSVIDPFFQWLTRTLLHRKFHEVQIASDFRDSGTAVLLIANHVGWWDGFWMLFLNQRVTRRRFFFMMHEAQLRKHRYFRHTGGFSVQPGSAEIRQSLHYAMTLLSDSRNLVLLFPQGKIHSAYQNNLHFERGAQYLADHIDCDTQVLFAASFTDYFSHPRPSLYIYTQTQPASNVQKGRLEEAYNLFYRKTLSHHQTLVS